MFEHYSVADLFANLYKKRKVNILTLLALFALIAVPFTIKSIKNKNTLKDTTSYSTYLSYKITPPGDLSKTILNHQIGGYSDFYAKLIDGNLNGAYLFNDVESSQLRKMASELDTTETALKNSTTDFWIKKITINSLIDDAGVSIKILTTSKDVNEFLEGKFDTLIDKFKSAYTNVKIEKLETINSKELTSSGELSLGFNYKNLILKLVIIGIVCLILLIFANILLYLFNPTINRAGDFSQYEIDFVTEITTIANLALVLSYKNAGQELTIVSSNKAILDKLKQNQDALKGIHFVDLHDVPSLLERDTVLLVEEYGVTRYKKFEQSLQILRNLNRSILGVATFKL